MYPPFFPSIYPTRRLGMAERPSFAAKVRLSFFIVTHNCLLWYIPVSVYFGLFERALLNLGLNEFRLWYHESREVDRASRHVIGDLCLSQELSSNSFPGYLECKSVEGLVGWLSSDCSACLYYFGVQSWICRPSYIIKEWQNCIPYYGRDIFNLILYCTLQPDWWVGLSRLCPRWNEVTVSAKMTWWFYWRFRYLLLTSLWAWFLKVHF